MDFETLLQGSTEVDKMRIAENTRRNYLKLTNRYIVLAAEIRGFPDPFPLNEGKMRGFLEYYRLTHPSTTYGYLRQFVSAFSHHFREESLPNLTLSPDFSNYMNGLRRLMNGDHCPKAKLPIDSTTMNDLANLIDTSKESEIEFMAIASLCFYGFLRISECLGLSLDDITNQNNNLIIRIISSKTDQTGRATFVYIRITNTRYHPIIWLKEHLKASRSNPNGKIFSLNQNYFRATLKNKLSLLDKEAEKYSTHSFRKGAAFSSALAGVQDCNIKSMGRWKSDVYQRYTAVTMKNAGDVITTKI